MRLLVLVLGARAHPFPLLVRTIRDTWASVDVESVETLFYFGGSALSLHADELVLPVSDGPIDIGRKTIACFEWSLENRDFDCVFRPNCSSYVDLLNLREYACTHARPERFYAGYIGVARGRPFVGGAGYFLSRDLVELVVRRQSAWEHKFPDDQALAAVLAEDGVQPEPAPRVDFQRARDVGRVDTSQFHFRCRTDSWRRREDRRIMRRIHRGFVEARPPAPSRRDHVRGRGR